jgi:outer membrane murein-binding lipoprotein Lpp
LRKYIDDLKAAVDAVDKEMQAARAEAEEAGRAKWYCMVTMGA